MSQPVFSCTVQELSNYDYIKAANFLDYFEISVRDEKFNSTPQDLTTFNTSLLSKALTLGKPSSLFLSIHIQQYSIS
jgi:hypothetical protein